MNTKIPVIVGFLVVLRHDKEAFLVDYEDLNPLYRGVDRMPAYPPTLQEEIEALDQYVFGGYKDDQSGVITEANRAWELLHLFDPSPRAYEVIWISNEKDASPPKSLLLKDLGYDVAGAGGDFYSIVSDFPKTQRLKPFLHKLNEAGLFTHRSTAEQFLLECQECRHVVADYPVCVFKVSEVTGKK